MIRLQANFLLLYITHSICLKTLSSEESLEKQENPPKDETIMDSEDEDPVGVASGG